jgi:DNA-binding Xre family transcriptional regulator
MDLNLYYSEKNCKAFKLLENLMVRLNEVSNSAGISRSTLSPLERGEKTTQKSLS